MPLGWLPAQRHTSFCGRLCAVATGVLHDATDDAPVDDRPPGEGIRRLSGWGVVLAASVVFWMVGALPWILDGMSLPPSAAWDGAGSAPGKPSAHKVMLPIGEHTVARLLVMTVVGGAVAVLVGRLARPDVRFGRWLAAGGAVLGAGLCAFQSRAEATKVLDAGSAARELLGTLTVAAVVFSLLGLAVGLAVTGARPWPRMLSLAFLAALLPAWLNDLAVRSGKAPASWSVEVVRHSAWVGGVVLGLALAFFGVQPARRLFGWLVALAITWVVPAMLTALVQAGGHVAGSSSAGEVVRSILGGVGHVFLSALSPSHHQFGPLVLAQTLGILGAAVLLTRRRGDA